MTLRLIRYFLFYLIISNSPGGAIAQSFNYDRLDRGFIAVRQNDHVYLSWRMFTSDYEKNVEFNVRTLDRQINSQPIKGKSNFQHWEANGESSYLLEVVDGDQKVLYYASVWEQDYLTINTNTPEGYAINDGSTGDLDGDGDLELIVKMEKATRDNSQSGFTDPVYIHAYDLKEGFLWSIDLGINIRAGAHYTQFMVYDLDGDNKAEIAMKTAPGTRDGTGDFLSQGPAANDNDNADYRNSGGYILKGPEYLTVFDGLTGREVATVEYNPPRHPDTQYPSGSQLDALWGDGYGNRVDRFLAGVAFLDGQKPSLVMCRGYYTRTVLAAWDFESKVLKPRWTFDSREGYPSYAGQGAHSLSIGDLDGDGKDEIAYGAMAIDDDGSPLYNTRFMHGDATHLGDLLPDRPGLEFFMAHEVAGYVHDGITNPRLSLRDAGTGDIIWTIEGDGDIGRGLTANIDSGHAGNEFWASSGLGVFDQHGNHISDIRPAINFAIWWDGDLQRELLDGVTISKWSRSGVSNLKVAHGCWSNNGSKSTPTLSGDLLGDWREEVVFRTEDNQALRIYTTTIPTDYGLPTLLEDRQYRMALVWQNVGYNQPPHPSYYIGSEMVLPVYETDSVIDADTVGALFLRDGVKSLVEVFPNPVETSLTLKTIEGLAIASLEVTDISGKSVSSKTEWNGNQLNVSNLGAGIYSLRIQTRDTNHTVYKRFIVR